nr:HNH endonuclease signature motif containing protein [Mycobacterium sp. NAZ190054]
MPAGASVVLHVIATADTVAGHSTRPGYLAGYGVIDADLVGELAREATRRLIEEPEVSHEQALTYRPSAALARYIRARDLTCRFPGCTVPATRCDIDHTEPFNHHDPTHGGHTVPENLACYCRTHHLIKTFDTGWRDQQLPDGTIIWTSPTGATYPTTPAGVALFGPMHRPRRPDQARRVAAARARQHQHRHTSTANLYRNRAAREEIRLRRWRNQSRRLRVLFHGKTTDTKPSTSPFSTWINDPPEDEQLNRPGLDGDLG